MSDAPAILRLAHDLLIDVVGGKVAGDAGESVDVGLTDRL